VTWKLLQTGSMQTQFLHFSPNNANSIDSLYLGDQLISRVSCTKFLGIYVDDRLKWDEHIHHVESKLASGAYALNAAKRFLTRSSLKTIYHSLIHSHIAYGNILWGSAARGKINRLNKLQKKCIRSIARLNYRENTESSFKQLNTMNINATYQFQLGKLLYRYFNNILTTSLRDIFVSNFDIHAYNTRGQLNAHMSNIRLSVVKNSFLHQGPKFWSEIPNKIKYSNSMAIFRNKLKYFLLHE
jgi:hypothetical protein